MTTKAAIEQFLALKVLVVAGASRDTKKFGYAVYRDLKDKGFTVYPVNPNAQTIDGERCYPTLAALPGVPEGLVIVTPPAQTEQLVRDAAQAGIRHIWPSPPRTAFIKRSATARWAILTYIGLKTRLNKTAGG